MKEFDFKVMQCVTLIGLLSIRFPKGNAEKIEFIKNLKAILMPTKLELESIDLSNDDGGNLKWDYEKNYQSSLVKRISQEQLDFLLDMFKTLDSEEALEENTFDIYKLLEIQV